MLMGLLGLPRARLYWSRISAVPLVTETMTRDRFFELRGMLHFADLSQTTDAQTENKLFRAEPIIESFRKACLELPRPKAVSVDEQMIPFSGRCPARQYVPSKPNPVGLKNDGLVLDFVIYTGKGTVPETDTKELGLGGAIVKRLLHTVPEEQPVHVFTGRFFTGLKLAEYLLRRNAHLTGTIMANRTGGAAPKLPNEKNMKRGESCCVVRSDGEMCLTKWKDRKSVMILSTACGITPEGTCRRWSKEDRKKVDVPQPHCIKIYNKNMGGVDLADRYVSYYRTKIRTKKWTIRVFAHFLDLAVANAWIEYRNDCKLMDVAAKDILDQFQFKNRVAEALIRAHVDEMQEAVNEVEQDLEIGETAALPKRTKVTSMLPSEVRLDKYGHFPEHVPLKSQMRCRNQGCSGKTRVRCTKCDLFLCLLNRNCFLDFHSC
ncbi:hypothetical protein MRX96_030440 [Rhipicephalus microplus]